MEITLRDLRPTRGAVLGTLLVLAGLASAGGTLFSNYYGDNRLTSAFAIASLVIVVLIVILVLPPLSRSAGAELAQLDLPVQVTTGGMIFVVLIVVVAFAAINTGNNLLFIVFSLLVSTCFVSIVAAQVALRHLVVSARFPDQIFAGEPAQVVVVLKNAKLLLPTISVLIEARGPVIADEKRRIATRGRMRFHKRTLGYFVYIPHRMSAEQKVDQLFPTRGHELITGFELSTHFPFGFFRLRRRLRARDVDIIICPKPETISDELHLLPINAGRLVSTRRGPGHDLLSLRDYQPRDDLRHIDWKATARVNRLTVREFAAEDERRITIWLDLVVDPGVAEDARRATTTKSGAATATVSRPVHPKDHAMQRIPHFEHGVTQAASLVAHFIEERAEVRLVLGNEAGRYGVGNPHLTDCLRRLALVEADIAGASGDNRFPDAAQLFQDAGPDSGSYAILLTNAKPGTIPGHIWRTSHVIYF